MGKLRLAATAFVLLVATALFSCGGKTDTASQRMRDFALIYGSPDHYDSEGRSYLPVEIFRQGDEWYAHYITSTGKPLADTKLELYCENGDTSVVYMKELSDGPAGYYTLSFADNGMLTYTSSRDEVFPFYTFFYKKDFETGDIDKAMEHIAASRKDELYSTQHIADYVRRLVKQNPATLASTFPRPNSAEPFSLDIATSPDGKLRLYNIKFFLGGNGNGNWQEYTMAQFASDGDTLAIDDFGRDDIIREAYQFPHVHVRLVGEMNDCGKTLYIVETQTYDEVWQVPEHRILRAYAIGNGGLVPQAVFRTSTKTLGEIDVRYFDESTDPIDGTLFRCLDSCGTLLVPLLKTDTLKTIDKHIVYQWDGNGFSYKGTETANKY